MSQSSLHRRVKRTNRKQNNRRAKRTNRKLNQRVNRRIKNRTSRQIQRRTNRKQKRRIQQRTNRKKKRTNCKVGGMVDDDDDDIAFNLIKGLDKLHRKINEFENKLNKFKEKSKKRFSFGKNRLKKKILKLSGEIVNLLSDLQGLLIDLPMPDTETNETMGVKNRRGINQGYFEQYKESLNKYHRLLQMNKKDDTDQRLEDKFSKIRVEGLLDQTKLPDANRKNRWAIQRAETDRRLQQIKNNEIDEYIRQLQLARETYKDYEKKQEVKEKLNEYLNMLHLNLEDFEGMTGEQAKSMVNKAYRFNAREYHPDKNPNDPEATRNFQRFRNTTNVLKQISPAFPNLSSKQQMKKFNSDSYVPGDSSRRGTLFNP